MTMPIYNLLDHVGWLTTRNVPLRSDSVTHIMVMVNTTYTDFIPKFAGMDTNNSLQYIQSFLFLLDNEDFRNEAQAVTMPYSLLDFIEVAYLVNAESFTTDMITQLFNCIELTPEFSAALAALSGMTPENCLDWEYKQVIQYQLMAFPKFVRDAQTFMLPV